MCNFQKIVIAKFLILFPFIIFSQTDTTLEDVVVKIYNESSVIIKTDYKLNDTLFTGKNYQNCKCIDTNSLKNDSCYYLLYYTDGNLEFQQGFYEDNSKMSEYSFSSGRKNGSWMEWYRGGQKKMDFFYSTVYNYPLGMTWYKNGQKKVEYVYFEDYGIVKEWFDNGQLKLEADMNFDGSSRSYTKSWCENGVITQDLKLNQGKTPFHDYDCKGRLIAEGTNIDFSLFWVGTKTVYYSNGQKFKEMIFEDGFTREEANIKTGLWKYWDEKGRLIKEEAYEANELIFVREY